jgi:hypothetical protein
MAHGFAIPLRSFKRSSCLYPRFSIASQIQKRKINSNNAFLKISEEVREALHSKKPVVALETTIYTHGVFVKVHTSNA